MKLGVGLNCGSQALSLTRVTGPIIAGVMLMSLNRWTRTGYETGGLLYDRVNVGFSVCVLLIHAVHREITSEGSIMTGGLIKEGRLNTNSCNTGRGERRWVSSDSVHKFSGSKH